MASIPVSKTVGRGSNPWGDANLNCEYGGIGRHKRLKISRRKVSRFDSGYSHQVLGEALLVLVDAVLFLNDNGNGKVRRKFA